MDLEEKLEKLEERLLQGDISDETYRELKEKYEKKRNSNVSKETGTNENKISDKEEFCPQCGERMGGKKVFKCKECKRVLCIQHREDRTIAICTSCVEEHEKKHPRLQCRNEIKDQILEWVNGDEIPNNIRESMESIRKEYPMSEDKFCDLIEDTADDLDLLNGNNNLWEAVQNNNLDAAVIFLALGKDPNKKIIIDGYRSKQSAMSFAKKSSEVNRQMVDLLLKNGGNSIWRFEI